MNLKNNLYLYPERGMLDCNTYVITGNPGVIIDPGNAMYLQDRLDDMRRDGIDPASIGMILNTHLHIDHSGANEAFREVSGAKIALHTVQKENYDFVLVEGSQDLGVNATGFTEDLVLDGNQLTAGGTEWEIILSPGHSPDCVCFYQRADKVLICGDVIFNMNIGRVDLPGGSADALKATVESLAKLDVEYLLPGHMDIVTGTGAVASNFRYIIGNIFPWL
jgi:glyoxylase-like metal-dependent hydrolase (beta-lactamase superfamily II)